MPKLPVFRTFGAALFFVMWNLPWLVVAAIPFLLFHSYFVLLTVTMVRVAFVNSFLRPFGYGGEQGFELGMVAGGIIAGPGYNFSPWVTAVVVICEMFVICIFAISIHRRVLNQAGVQMEAFVWSRQFWSYFGLGVLFLATTAAFLFGIVPIMPYVFAAAHAWFPANPSIFISISQIVIASLMSWLLLKLGITLAATAASDSQFNFGELLHVMGSDFWRTIGLNALMGIMFAMLSLLVVTVGGMLFGTDTPLGFDARYAMVMGVYLVQFWFQFVVTLTLVTFMYRHYRET